jgi:hypothetical protein
MRWRTFGVRKKKEFYIEGAESTEVTEKRKARRARCIVPLQDEQDWGRAKKSTAGS